MMGSSPDYYCPTCDVFFVGYPDECDGDRHRCPPAAAPKVGASEHARGEVAAALAVAELHRRRARNQCRNRRRRLVRRLWVVQYIARPAFYLCNGGLGMLGVADLFETFDEADRSAPKGFRGVPVIAMFEAPERAG